MKLDERQQKIREYVLSCTHDLVSALAWYDRKDDEELDRDTFEEAIKNKYVTLEEIAEEFKKTLFKNITDDYLSR